MEISQKSFSATCSPRLFEAFFSVNNFRLKVAENIDYIGVLSLFTTFSPAVFGG